ncbi:TPA: hypothetical protein ACRL4L_005782, partial [Pseudomonas aeruginosa]
MRPEPTNAPAALSRRFSVAPMMDRSNYKKL